jgi:hypothetical protein
MPRKSVYFPDEQWPRIERAAELEDRSVSKWLQRAADRAMAANQVKARDSPRWCEVCGTHGDHHTDRHDMMTDAS